MKTNLPPLQSPGALPAESRHDKLTLSDFWRIILKRSGSIFLSVVFALTLSIIYTHTKIPLYEAHSSVRITGPRAFQYEGGMLTPQGDLLTNYADRIRGNEVTERVVIRLKLLPPDAKAQDLTDKAAEIGRAISTTLDSETETIHLRVVYPNPELAAAIANQAAEVLVKGIDKVPGSDVRMTAAAAIPTAPAFPNKQRNKLAGALAGLAAGILLAFIRENKDTSIGAIENAEQALRLPVIGVLPHFNHKESKSFADLVKRRKDLESDSSFLIMNQEPFSGLSEAYRILRADVEFLMGEKTGLGRVMMVTSTGPQEGKTLTACNLAISLAQDGRKVLLIDADLRRPAVHRLFGLKRSPGLSDILMGTVSLDEAKKTMGDILVGETSQWDHMLTSRMLDRLEIVTTGIHSPTPAQLIGSEAMKRLLEVAKQKYDYVLMDTPPVLPVTDARTLGLFADATFFIYRPGKTARRSLTRAQEELSLAGVQVKGIVLNQATPEVTLT